MAELRVVIIGAGPAGIRCAEALVAAGLRPVVVDEGRRSGGQIYRRQPELFSRSYEQLYGTEASRARAIHEAFDALLPQIDYRPETLAWNVAGHELHTLSEGRYTSLSFDALVLCTGAMDRLMPVPGWNLAGTYSLGGAQVALKSQACTIGRKVAFMGSGPLLYLIAAQYAASGAGVAAVLDTSLWIRRLLALPGLLGKPRQMWNGIRMMRTLRSAGILLQTGIVPVAIEGTASDGVYSLSYLDRRGRPRSVECDAVAIGWHLRPETQLADLAGCDFRFDAGTRQWLPLSDSDGRSSVPGIYLAGDGLLVQGADAAETTGRLAAFALLRDQGLPVPTRALATQRRQRRHHLRFARALNSAFPWPWQQIAALSDDTILCRCESVTVKELRRTVTRTGADESNRAKAFSRVGMGRCQGRYCGHAAAELIAHCAAVPIRQAGRLRGQAPVKPLPIALEEETR